MKRFSLLQKILGYVLVPVGVLLVGLGIFYGINLTYDFYYIFAESIIENLELHNDMAGLMTFISWVLIPVGLFLWFIASCEQDIGIETEIQKVESEKDEDENETE